MAAHARLKNELMEDEKYHNLMRWLNWYKVTNRYHYSFVLYANAMDFYGM